MGVKVSNRTAATLASIAEDDLLLLAREDAADLKVAISEMRKKVSRPRQVVLNAATLTLTEDDHDGATILVTYTGGAVAITVPDGLPLNFSCTIVRGHGASAVTIQGDGTILLDDESNAPATGNTYTVNTRGVATVLVYDDASPDTARVFGGVA